MRKYFLPFTSASLIVLVCTLLQVNALLGVNRVEQLTSSSHPMPESIESVNGAADSKHWQVYQLAIKNGDYQTAVTALYYEMAENPNKKELRDTLAAVYFAIRAFPQCLTVVTELLQERPNDQRLLEVSALCLQAFGSLEGLKRSLEQYEKLYGLSKSVYHLYQIATLQYNLKRSGECGLSVEQLLKSPDIDKEKVSISAGQNQTQEVSMRAAALNIRGVLLLEAKNIEGAKQNFKEALKLEPNFILAKGNLELAEKPAGAKPATGTGK
jgi:tetratricopeptide (TPR) repeat protein